MKIEELMIGDLVYYSYVSHFVTKVIDVCTHDEEPFIKCKRDPKDNLYVPGKFEDFHVGILRPIPLTSEILEKNGFERKGKDYLIKGYVYWSPFAKRLFMNGHPFQIDYIDLDECQYIHQLQHFLHNAKIEKEIKMM